MLQGGGDAAIVNPAGFSWRTDGRTAAGRGEPGPGQLEDTKHKSSGLNPPHSPERHLEPTVSCSMAPMHSHSLD